MLSALGLRSERFLPQEITATETRTAAGCSKDYPKDFCKPPLPCRGSPGQTNADTRVLPLRLGTQSCSHILAERTANEVGFP